MPFESSESAPVAEVEHAGHQWADRAMCHDKTELFFARPGEREGRRNRREALARAYCACCPVQRMCLLAGRLGREHGMWGGENDEQRAAAGFGPKSPHRRAVARAAREARIDNGCDADENETSIGLIRPVSSTQTSPQHG